VTVRVRFAPAPTGDLHVGNVRTALFNWLFARHEGGSFVLRIEDTDPEKAKPELIEPIFESLKWIGLDWDEGPDIGGPHAPYRQSERRDHHREVLQRLIDSGHVYRCYCTREDIAARGTKTGYDRHCRTLNDEERRRNEDESRPFALRFAVHEDKPVIVNDLIRGEVRREFEDMQDFIVARSDGSPTFVVANAADDIVMEITHAIRGTDLLSAAFDSTLIFEALQAEPPKYAHVPLVNGPDGARLGARHGAVGILAYRNEGFLAEAMLNFLALLGWSSPSGDELLSKERLIAEFTLDRVHPAPGAFDRAKLTWMNQEYIKQLSNEELESRVLELFPETPQDGLRKALELELVQTRVETLAQIPRDIRYLYERPEIDSSSADKFLGTEEANRTLREAADRIENLEPWTVEAIHDSLMGLVEELGLHKRKGPQPLRVAISGSHVSLPLFESIWIIGRDEAVDRLRAAISG
jgi:glutamyl-tRNA synthetase